MLSTAGNEGIGQSLDFLRNECLLNPDSGPLRMELAGALLQVRKVSEATDLYFHLYQDGFRQPIVLAALATSLLAEGRVSEAIAACRAALSQDPHLLCARSSLVFAMGCMDGVDALDLFHEHVLFGQLLSAPARIQRKRKPGRIRVGFLCAWFNNHPAGRFSLPAVAHLNRGTFDSFCYHSGPHRDSVTEQFKNAAGHWRNVSDLEDAAAAALIQQDDLDILIELDGHTGGNKLSVVAQKPARKIVTWLGYMNTTGLPAVDYRIVDHITDPEPLASSLHTETLLKIAAPFTVFSAPEPSPPVSNLPALANGHITFGAFGQLMKHSDSAIDAISRAVLAVPQAHLKLVTSACRDAKVREAVIARFEQRGIPANRIDCGAAPKGNYAYLASHHQVDIMLDMMPFNGTTTTCESLWMGVPMVTLQGQSHRQRVSSSFLTAAGYPELIATSVDGYVNISKDLANNIPRLANMRAEMRKTLLASRLMDIPAFVNRFENALLSIASS